MRIEGSKGAFPAEVLEPGALVVANLPLSLPKDRYFISSDVINLSDNNKTSGVLSVVNQERNILIVESLLLDVFEQTGGSGLGGKWRIDKAKGGLTGGNVSDANVEPFLFGSAVPLLVNAEQGHKDSNPATDFVTFFTQAVERKDEPYQFININIGLLPGFSVSSLVTTPVGNTNLNLFAYAIVRRISIVESLA